MLSFFLGLAKFHQKKEFHRILQASTAYRVVVENNSEMTVYLQSEFHLTSFDFANANLQYFAGLQVFCAANFRKLKYFPTIFNFAGQTFLKSRKPLDWRSFKLNCFVARFWSFSATTVICFWWKYFFTHVKLFKLPISCNCDWDPPLHGYQLFD